MANEIVVGPPADAFFDGVARLMEQARSRVAPTADLAMRVTYFEVGAPDCRGGAERLRPCPLRVEAAWKAVRAPKRSVRQGTLRINA
jgi:hypothetical protein